MTAPTLTRRPRGIDPGVGDPAAGPCRYDPAAWDIDRAENGYSVQVLTATAACRRCPLRARCERATAAFPPQHLCVAAAKVWVNGQPVDPLAWLRGDDVTDADRRVCAADGCGRAFVPRSATHRYCGRACAGTAGLAALNEYRASRRRAHETH